MKRKLLSVSFIVLSFFLAGNSLFAQTYPTIYASMASGAWTATTVWESFTGNATNTPGAQGTGTPYTGGTNPTGTHFVYIRSGHTITMGANRSCIGMTVENGATLLAGGTFRLQLATGGTGFAAPQNWSVTNNGTIGSATDGIYFEPGTNAGAITLTGTGIYNISRLRMPGGLVGSGNGTVSVTINANINFNLTSNYVLSAVYNSATTDNYTITISSGRTVTVSAGAAYFHNGGTSSTAGGNYTYSINGTLDLSATTGNVSLSPLGTTGSTINVNVGGTLKLGSGAFSADTVGSPAAYGKTNLNISSSGLVDASAVTTSTFKTGTEIGQYFILTGTGAALKRNVGSTATLFPIGTSAANYNPATLTNTGTADNFTVTLKGGFDNAPVVPTQVVNKQWSIAEQATGASVTTSFGWVTADQAASFNPAGTVDVMNYTTSWNNYGLSGAVTGAGTTANPYIASSNKVFTTFGNFGITNGTVLPLTLLSFSGVNTGSSVQLAWTTVNEINSSDFEVQKSTDAQVFNTIGTVAANNTTAQNDYAFTDVNPSTGTAYYRLKMVDKDGSYKFSQVISVSNKSVNALSVYPNPIVGGQMNVQVSGFDKGTYTLQLFSINGQVVSARSLTLDGGASSMLIQLPVGVKTGIYQLQLTNGVTKAVKTILVQ